MIYVISDMEESRSRRFFVCWLVHSFVHSLVWRAETVAEGRHAGLCRRGRCAVGFGWRGSKVLGRVCGRLRRGCRVGVLHGRGLVHGVYMDALGGHRVLVRCGRFVAASVTET